MADYEFSEEESVSIAVIEAVAAVSGIDPLKLPPLYDAIDPEALDALFETHDRPADADLRATFSYNGFTVDVRDGPHVTVQKQ